MEIKFVNTSYLFKAHFNYCQICMQAKVSSQKQYNPFPFSLSWLQERPVTTKPVIAVGFDMEEREENRDTLELEEKKLLPPGSYEGVICWPFVNILSERTLQEQLCTTEGMNFFARSLLSLSILNWMKIFHFHLEKMNWVSVHHLWPMHQHFTASLRIESSNPLLWTGENIKKVNIVKKLIFWCLEKFIIKLNDSTSI